MIDGNERFVPLLGQFFGVADADFQGRGQPRPDGDRHGVKICSRPLQRLPNHIFNFRLVGPFGQMGDDPTVFGVDIDLRGDDVC